MPKYINQSIYECERPILLKTSCAVTPFQTLVTKRKVCGKDVQSLIYRDTRPTFNPVRCGRCNGCQRLLNDQWFVRMLHHYKGLVERYGRDDVAIGFATLTFNPEHMRYCYENLIDIPLDEFHGADYRPIYNHYVVPFKKRLRAKKGENLSFDFFCTSEFGEQYNRFHFHVVFFFRGLTSPEYRISRDSYVRAHQRDVRHYVRFKKELRLQTDDELYLQSCLERQWTSTRYVKRSDRLVVERSKNGKRKRVTSVGIIGNVSFFIADSVGMLKYTTNYTVKCRKDGISTYHRQTGGLGKEYASKHLSQLIFDDMLPVCSTGKVKGKELFIPTPRVYNRWLGDKWKQIRSFWSTVEDRIVQYERKTGYSRYWKSTLQHNLDFF